MAIDKTKKTRIIVTVTTELKEQLEVQAQKEYRTVANLLILLPAQSRFPLNLLHLLIAPLYKYLLLKNYDLLLFSLFISSI